MSRAVDMWNAARRAVRTVSFALEVALLGSGRDHDDPDTAEWIRENMDVVRGRAGRRAP